MIAVLIVVFLAVGVYGLTRCKPSREEPRAFEKEMENLLSCMDDDRKPKGREEGQSEHPQGK